MDELALAVDFGGTNIRVALLDREARMSHRHSTSTETEQGREAVFERLTTALNRVMDATDRSALAGIGVSLAGPTDPVTGTVYSPPNLPGWHGFSLKGALEEVFELPVNVVNDATVAALAEYRYGAARGYSNVIYITVSTGVGGGFVFDGKLYGGSRGFAAEIGHMVIERSGPRCSCGNRGCLEAMASGTAVARMARERLDSGERSVLLDTAGGDSSTVDARMVAEAARGGDAMAVAVMAEASSNLGIGLVSLLHAFDPDIVVIGGGMSENLDTMLPEINREIEERSMAPFKGQTRIVKSELGDDVGLVGAAALVFEEQDGRVSS